MEDLMTDSITLTGLVATAPRHIVTSEGLAISSFRLASTQRRFDRSTERWIDGDTNWYTITGFRQLAINVAGSVSKGQRVVVFGRLRIREWENGERSGTTIEVEADSIGHDLAWGSSAFTRNISSAALPTSEGAELASAGGDELSANLEGKPESATDSFAEEELSSIPF
jgi:single-strand DNA-binding protein